MRMHWGRVPAARGRAVVLRIEPLSKAHRLDRHGLPSVVNGHAAGGGYGSQAGRRRRLRQRESRSAGEDFAVELIAELADSSAAARLITAVVAQDAFGLR
jgi:hypothetical protein